MLFRREHPFISRTFRAPTCRKLSILPNGCGRKAWNLFLTLWPVVLRAWKNWRGSFPSYRAMQELQRFSWSRATFRRRWEQYRVRCRFSNPEFWKSMEFDASALRPILKATVRLTMQHFATHCGEKMRTQRRPAQLGI